MTWIVRRCEDGSVSAAGELDLATAPEAVDQLLDALPSSGDATIDVSGLTFIDSSGVRALVTVAERLAPGRLVLLDPSATVRRVLDLVGITEAGTIAIDPPNA